MSRNILTHGIFSIICAEANDTQLYGFKNLIKCLNMDYMSYDLETVYDYNTEKFVHRNYMNLPINYPEMVIKEYETPISPFILLPLFEIQDYKKMNIHHSFFKNLVNNEIVILDKKVDEPTYILGVECDPQVRRPKVYMKVGNKKFIDISQESVNYKSGYFVFKNPYSENAMVYYGVFVEKNGGNFLNTELGKIYEHFIQNKETTDKDIKKGNIQFIIQLDINEFRRWLDLKVELPSKSEKKPSFALKLILPDKIPKNSSDLIIKLSGETGDDGELYFTIDKLYDLEITPNLKFELIGMSEESTSYYKAFRHQWLNKPKPPRNNERKNGGWRKRRGNEKTGR